MEHSNNKKGNLVLRHLTKNQKEKLMSGKVGLAGIALGAGAFSLMSFVNHDEAIAEDATDTTSADDAVVICTEAPFSEKVSPEMSFDKAFATAREEVGAGGFFEYKGQLYNTYTKEEWDTMSEEQHEQYWHSIDDKTSSISVVDAHQDVNMHTPIDDIDTVAVTEVDYDDTHEANTTTEVEHNGEVHTEIVHSEDVYTDDANYTVEGVSNETGETEYYEDHQPIDVHVEYIEAFDFNQDGYIDAYVVDADGNGIPDMIFDDNFDGTMDALVIDVNEQGYSSVDEEYVIGHDVVVNEAPEIDHAEMSHSTTTNVSSDELVYEDDTNYDDLSDTDLNPTEDHGIDDIANQNFDNDYDIDEYNI